MKKIFLLAVLTIFLTASGAWAVTYTGTTNLTATTAWDDATFSWSATDEDPSYSGFWVYEYTFADSISDDFLRDLSHVIIEVSENFTEENIEDYSTGNVEEFSDPATFGPEGPGASNPGIPGEIFGVKWDVLDDTSSFDFWIVSDRSPMWGDVYMKDGASPMTDGFVYAYNEGFGSEAEMGIMDGNFDWALVPDTTSQPVPEPGTMLLLGAGLLGFAAVVGRKYRSRSER